MTEPQQIMYISLSKKELLGALHDLDRAEKNGFLYCLGIFQIKGLNGVIGFAEYSDLLEKAHPTDGQLNWGRGQDITKRFHF